MGEMLDSIAGRAPEASSGARKAGPPVENSQSVIFDRFWISKSAYHWRNWQSTEGLVV